MRAIPKALLIHTITLHKKENEDRWGNGNLDTGITIQYVRMEPSSKIIRDKIMQKYSFPPRCFMTVEIVYLEI